MLAFSLTLVVLLVTVVCYYIKRLYFTLIGPIPGLPPQFLVGNLLQTGVLGQNLPMNVVFLKLKAQFGDIFQFWLGSTRIIVVSSLEDVQHIFSHRQIYDQGDIFVDKISLVNPNAMLCMRGKIESKLWKPCIISYVSTTHIVGAKFKRHASIVSTLFRGNKVNVHLETIFDCTDKLLSRWRTYNNDPNQVHLNMIEQSQQLALAIFGYIAFDFDLQTLEDENNSVKHELTRALYSHLYAAMALIQLPVVVGRLYLFLSPEYRKARQVIDRYLREMIDQELRETPAMRAERKRSSLIASLVASLQSDEKLEATKSEEEKRGSSLAFTAIVYLSYAYLLGLSQTEVMGEMLSFLPAGYSTTSTALVWFIFFMSKYPQVQLDIKRELAEYQLQRLTPEQLDSLSYLDCVLQEVFRFVPPVIGTVRTLVTDDQLPSSGAPLKKGDQVFIPFYNLSRDPRYWSEAMDPSRFCPERFLPENIQLSNRAASIPFGGGHRQCPGQDLARLELKAICVRLMQHVSFGDGGSAVNAGGYKQTDTILPKYIGVTINFD